MTHQTANRRRPALRAPFLIAGLAVAVLTSDLTAQWGGRGRLFSLPRSQDDIYEWKEAQKDAAAGRVDGAVERLHRLLQNDQSGVVPLDDSDERYMGLRAAVISTLANLPEAGRNAYEKLTARNAGRRVRTAFDGIKIEELESLAEGFPASAAGRRARLRLGDLALEAGRGIEAEFHYRAAFDGLPSGSTQRREVMRRMRAAQILSHSAPRTGIGDLQAEVERELEPVLPSSSIGARPGGWTAYGGGGDATGIMEQPLGDLELQYQVEIRARGFYERRFPMHAIGDITGLFVNDGLRVHCVDPLTGDRLWIAPGPLIGDPNEDPEDYEPAINQDVVLAPACSADIVVAALQVANPSKPTRFRSIDVIRKIPRRRLFAFDRTTGKRLWSHFDRIDGPLSRRFRGHDAAGPPLIFGDTIYVGSHDQTGAIAYYLTAYDLATGKTKWRQLICSSQGEVNMFGNSRREFASSPLAISNGLIVGATNLGVCFAAEAASGRVRWITAYEVIPLPETRLTDQRDRDVIFANNTVVVANGVVACTPLDSWYALAFDLENGDPLWRLHYKAQARGARNDIRWLVGALEDEFIFSGLGVVAVKARPTRRGTLQPKVAGVRSPESLGFAQDIHASPYAVPRGALTADRIYYASPDGLRAFSRRGDARMARLVADNRLGNLLLVDGILVSLRGGSLEVYYDRQKLVQDAQQRARRDPKNPAALLRLASLVRGGASTPTSGLRADRAETLYRRALDVATEAGMGHKSPVFRRIANELFQLSVERAERMHTTQPTKALAVMRRARDAALRPDQWLLAQRSVLAWVPSTSDYLEELALMSELHGSVVQNFERVGRMPVAAYALWQTALRSDDPAVAMRSCQDLLERYPDSLIVGRFARDAAREKQEELLRRHGREIYANIEEQAAEALGRAAGDPELLRGVAQRYPPSRAAATAMRQVMDLAVERGDLAAAVRSFSQAIGEGQAGGGVYRRMLEAARVAGNTALARELAKRLLRDHADEASDFGPDAGRLIGDVVAAPASPPPPDPPQLQRPVEIVDSLSVGVRAIALRLCATRLVDGFRLAKPAPLLVSVGGSRLDAFDTAKGSTAFDAPLYSVPFAYQEGEQLLICGETLVLPDLDRVRGVDLRTGAAKWSLRADANRMLISLGCQAGILHVFSEHRGDSGILMGIEPLTGATLFERPFPAGVDSHPPASSGGALWLFRPSRSDDTVIERLDPMSGQVTHSIPLDASLLRKLELSDPDTRYWKARQIHKSIFADDDTVYVPIDGGNRTPPRLAALDFDGRPRWTVWRGEPGRELEMAALHDDRIVILERGGQNSRLLILNQTGGAIRREMMLGPALSIRNWSRREHSEPAPDVMLLVDRPGNVEWNLTCYSFNSRVSSFAHRLHRKYVHVIPTPVLGEDFIAIAARTERQQIELSVLDLVTRRSLLPDGDGYLRLPLQRPFKMQACDPYVAIQSAKGITILGESGRPPK